MPRASWTTLAATLVAALALAAPTYAADGDLDDSFAEDGISHLERGHFAHIARQADGKLIVAGQSSGEGGEALVGRLTASGSPDPTFGDGGFTAVAPTNSITLSDVAVAPDGRVVVAGGRTGGSGDAILYGFTGEGEPDLGFSGDGVAPFGFGSEWNSVGAIAFQADGRLVAVGEHFDEQAQDSTAAAARFSTDGSLDETFAGDGTTLLDVGHAEYAWQVLFQGDDIVVAGMRGPPVYEHADFWAVRLDATGARDETFGTAGTFVTKGLLTWDSEDGVVTAGGGLVFAGTTEIEGGRDAGLLRLDADGHPDESFGPGGLRAYDVAGTNDTGRDVAAAHDGNLALVATTHTPGLGNSLAVVKVTSGGAPVLSFGDGGKRLYDSIGRFDAVDALYQPDGKLVVGGDDNEGMAVVRIHDTAPPAPPAPPDDGRLQPASLPILTLSAGSAVEGQLLPFTATLSRPSDQPVSFSYFTGEGTAAGGRDFGQRSGTATIAPGQTSATIAVPTNEDRLFETDESFRVELHGATNARFGEYVAFGTIVNDLRSGRCQNVVQGRRGTDILTGSPGGDLIVGRQDVDFLFGLGGPDCIRGERGGDIIDGGDGDDSLDGGSGDDRIKGGDGDDRLYGRRGRNRYNGGSGDDRIYARNGIAEIVECGAGRDRVKADSRDRLRRCEIVSR